MGVPLEGITEVYMANYPEAQTDEYFMSSDCEEEGSPEMNDIFLPKVVRYNYLQISI